MADLKSAGRECSASVVVGVDRGAIDPQGCHSADGNQFQAIVLDRKVGPSAGDGTGERARLVAFQL